MAATTNGLNANNNNNANNNAINNENNTTNNINNENNNNNNSVGVSIPASSCTSGQVTSGQGAPPICVKDGAGMTSSATLPDLAAWNLRNDLLSRGVGVNLGVGSGRGGSGIGSGIGGVEGSIIAGTPLTR